LTDITNLGFFVDGNQVTLASSLVFGLRAWPPPNFRKPGSVSVCFYHLLTKADLLPDRPLFLS
jgi:hypothetical protein